jgi:hypothetical protein
VPGHTGESPILSLAISGHFAHPLFSFRGPRTLNRLCGELIDRSHSPRRRGSHDCDRDRDRDQVFPLWTERPIATD